MEMILECLMLLAFIAATCMLIDRFLKKQSQNPAMDRIFAWTAAAGFTFGVIKELTASPVRWLLIPYLIGAAIAYVAAALSCKKDLTSGGNRHE